MRMREKNQNFQGIRIEICSLVKDFKNTIEDVCLSKLHVTVIQGFASREGQKQQSERLLWAVPSVERMQVYPGRCILEGVPSIMKMKEMRQLQPYIIKHLNPNFPFSESILIKN